MKKVIIVSVSVLIALVAFEIVRYVIFYSSIESEEELNRKLPITGGEKFKIGR